jgi:hypothetical protein
MQEPSTKNTGKQLSVAECRTLLKRPNLADAQIERIRDALFEWIERYLDQYFYEELEKAMLP